MNDAVLARVGRRHTAAQTVAAYEAARAAGYDAVNGPYRGPARR